MSPKILQSGDDGGITVDVDDEHVRGGGAYRGDSGSGFPSKLLTMVFLYDSCFRSPPTSFLRSRQEDFL
jgi:hypothetical protein